MLPIIFNVAQVPKEYGTGYLENKMVLFDNIDERKPVVPEYSESRRFPVKSEAFFLVYIVAGVLELDINLRQERIEAGQMLVMMPGSIFMPKPVGDDLRMFALIIEPEFTEMIRKNLGVKYSLVPRYYHHVVHDLTAPMQVLAEEMFRNVKKELTAPPYASCAAVVQRYLEIWIMKNHAISNTDKGPELHKAMSRKEQILHDFLTLLEKHYTEERSISFYADRMCLTPKYLSTIIKEVSGKHGMQWIDEYVSLEAKALLRNSDLSVKQVSDQLNFPSQSMFGRFFKKMTGYSPKQYKML